MRKKNRVSEESSRKMASRLKLIRNTIHHEKTDKNGVMCEGI